MLAALVDWIVWLYWKANRPFLRALAESLIGDGVPELNPRGEIIIADSERFLRLVPRHVLRQIAFALFFLPLSVRARAARSRWTRLAQQIWRALTSHSARALFLASSRLRRARRLDALFRALARQAATCEHDLIRDVAVVANLKSLLCATYMDSEPVWRALGYRPVSRRGWSPPSGPDVEHPPPTESARLLRDRQIEHPSRVPPAPPGKTTYCVIGSGAGGAIAARSIQELDSDAHIVLLEAGPLVTNDRFPRHALEATATLFMNAGATLTADQAFTFRQGFCVGGSTTVNNAVAFKPVGFWWDRNIVDRWEEAGAHLDWRRLHAGYGSLEAVIEAHTVEERVVTAAARKLREGFERIGLGPATHLVAANTRDCIGCGRCNLGCQYDAKRSMLDAVIPRTISSGNAFLVPRAKVERLLFERSAKGLRVTAAEIVPPDGAPVTLRADRFVLAAGAYASTKLLWDSGFTGASAGLRTVGKRFTCNFGSPVIGRFPNDLRGWDGQQIGYVAELPEERMIIETAFAPPAALGMLAPQWGKEFMRLVQSYGSLAVAAPTLASLDYGEIREGLLGDSGYVIDFAPGKEDWRRLARGMEISAKAMLAMGAEEIYTTRFDARALRAGEDPGRYFAGLGPADCLKVESSHPQGGNVIHRDAQHGVVDADLKVHGVTNLWICDASVIPSAITLNLQLTVMALARYASPAIVAG